MKRYCWLWVACAYAALGYGCLNYLSDLVDSKFVAFVFHVLFGLPVLVFGGILAPVCREVCFGMLYIASFVLDFFIGAWIGRLLMRRFDW